MQTRSNSISFRFLPSTASLTHTHTHSHTHTQSLSLSLSLSLSHTHTHTHSHSLVLSFPPRHTHTHEHIRNFLLSFPTLACTNSLPLPPSPSLSFSLFPTLAQTYIQHTLSLFLSPFSLSLSFTSSIFLFPSLAHTYKLTLTYTHWSMRVHWTSCTDTTSWLKFGQWKIEEKQ